MPGPAYHMLGFEVWHGALDRYSYLDKFLESFAVQGTGLEGGNLL